VEDLVGFEIGQIYKNTDLEGRTNSSFKGILCKLNDELVLCPKVNIPKNIRDGCMSGKTSIIFWQNASGHNLQKNTHLLYIYKK